MAEQARDPGAALSRFWQVMTLARRECAWKREQTHASLRRYLVEEAYETLDAIERLEQDGPDDLCEELGDLLLQVVFHAVIAEESGAFDLAAVAMRIEAKMRARNPHLFGDCDGRDGSDGEKLDAAAINELWEQRKAAEKRHRTEVMDGVPGGLPALLYADKALDRYARVGAPLCPDPDPDTGEYGERLFALVAEARTAGVDPEAALRETVRHRIARSDQPVRETERPT